MRRLLVLGAGINQAPLYRAAGRMGLSVVGIDPDPGAVAFGDANASHVCDLADFDECLRIARQSEVDAVLTIAADFPVPMVARLNEALNLPGPSVAAVQRATDKQLMRAAFADSSVPAPRSIPVRCARDAVEAAAKLGGTVVVKPALSSGGRGITAVEATAPQDQLTRALQHCMAHARNGWALVEEFAAGAEYSVESITQGGQTKVVAMTEKLTSGPPHFVELGHNQPAELSEQARDELSRTAVAAIEALGIDESASHVEIRLTDGGPSVIEAAARLGGGFIASHLVPLSMGVDLLQAAIQVALGEEFELPHPDHRGAAVRFFVAEPGVITGIDGLCQAQQSAGVVEAQLYDVRVGEEVLPLRDATARLGHLICSGSNRTEAVRLAEEAHRLVTITTVPKT